MNKRALQQNVLRAACVATLALVSCSTLNKLEAWRCEILRVDAQRAARLVAEGRLVVLDIRPRGSSPPATCGARRT